MDKLTIGLGVFAGAVHLVAFFIYNKQMLRGESLPNSATWTLWVFLGALGISSYFSMTGDWIKCILSLVGLSACAGTFIFTLKKGKFGRLDFWDKTVLMGGIFSAIIWWITRSATYANLFLQVCFLASFFPTWRGVWKNPTSEKYLPWFIWTFGHGINLLLIIIRYDGLWPSLVFPISSIFCHGLVGALALRGKNKQP